MEARIDANASRRSARPGGRAARRRRAPSARTTCVPTRRCPTSFKELGGWRTARAARRRRCAAAWWELYDDPELSGLEEQVAAANQNLAAAEARFRQARDAGAGRRAATGSRRWSWACRSRARASSGTLARRPGLRRRHASRPTSRSRAASRGSSTCGEDPPEGRVERGERAGERRRPGEHAAQPAGRAGGGLLPAPRARRPASAPRRHGAELRAVARADAEPARAAASRRAPTSRRRRRSSRARARRRSTSACSARRSSTPSPC